MPVEVRINGAQWQRALRRRGGPGDRYVRQVAARAAIVASGLAPGSAGRQITVEDAPNRRGAAVDVVSNHPASVFLIRGTRPHLIRPRRRRALRFEAGGRQVFAKLVRHPGTKGFNYLLEALRRVL
ncbi:hypothetical protein E1211_25900 [Micromonospora sp. 15K316]|uniref:hypothetical protein n=1 Tax=Micromonospora sp. 15K316 TaxID=2530376 RepID=UPI001052F809|nr:hypothetical protein [Micromonospora sp. 15K316]TDC29495.1 hypothetical protein E1211_25900 [Micromonospora sp. 15K316]